MCGRFTQTKSREEAVKALGDIELPPLFHGRYNVAPTQAVAVIRQDTSGQADEFVWGFENPAGSSPVINARYETLTERPMFRDLLTTHRCLIPADGFYEWKGRQPYYFQPPGKQLFAFAGLWRDNRCIVITRAASSDMQGIHHRMPVILAVKDWGNWLHRAKPLSQFPLTTRPVSRRVNSVTNDDPACIAPVDEQLDLSLFLENE